MTATQMMFDAAADKRLAQLEELLFEFEQVADESKGLWLRMGMDPKDKFEREHRKKIYYTNLGICEGIRHAINAITTGSQS